MSSTNGSHPPTYSDLDASAEAVNTMLIGERLDDYWAMEQYGVYGDLINRLILASVVGLKEVQKLWSAEAPFVPALAAKVGWSLPPTQIVSPRDLRTRLHAWYQEGGVPRGVSPGWPSVERIYRVAANEVTLITGMPSAGKSTFVSAMLVNLMTRYAWPVTIFSPEQSPLERLAVTFIEQLSGMPFDEGPTERMSPQTLDQMLELLQPYIRFIWTGDDSPSLDQLLDLAREEVATRQIRGLAIDPWNDLSHPDFSHGREDLYIGQSMTKLRQFARTNNVHVWLVAHPKQMIKDATNQYPVPSPYDISGGAKWRDKADNILSLWRSLQGAEARYVEVHTQKIRFRENGQMGHKATLLYHPATGRYSDVAA